MSLRRACLEGAPGPARSVVLVDAENLFRGMEARIPKLLRVLDWWAARQVPPPTVMRTYGFPRAVSRKWQPVQAMLDRLGAKHVSTRPGKDVADHALEADLISVRDLAVAAVLGSADYSSIRRSLDGLAGGSTTVEWIVMTPHSRRPHSRPMAPGGELADFPVSRVTTIDQIYQAYVAGRRSKPPDERAEPPGAVEPLHLTETDWDPLRRTGSLELDAGWRTAAVNLIGDSVGVDTADARELVTALAAWLPEAVPDHYHRDLGSLSTEAWAWHCCAALTAAALVPGALSGHLAGRVLLALDGPRAEFEDLVLERAVTLVRTARLHDQRDYLRLARK